MNSIAPGPTTADQTSQLRFGLIIFGAALLANFHLFTIGWDNTLLGFHEFRQVQTAISSYYYLQAGVSVDYITPLLGPPWQIPLEFPLYQISVAVATRWTGLPLDAVGRLVSWLYFLSSLPAGYLLLARFRLPAGSRLMCLALLLLSPIYLYFSRVFLMESTAFSAGVWFLLAFDRTLNDRRFRWLPIAIIAGTLACIVKITTGIIFLTAAGMQVLVLWRNQHRPSGDTLMKIMSRAAAAAVPPLLAGLFWTHHANQIRALNPDAGFLSPSSLAFWTFGDLGQRFSFSFWFRTSRVWADEIVGEAGLIILVLYFAWKRGRYLGAVIGCLAAFMAGQLIFSNLYWVHDYYFYASAIFLVAAVGFCLSEILEAPTLSLWRRRAVVCVFLVLQLGVFDRSFLPAQKKQTPVPQLTELVAAISQPDDTIVILGQDWDGALPYYAGRKALMLLTGRERDPAAMRKSIERLDPRQVAAVVVVGINALNGVLINDAMASLNLGSRPFLFDSINTGIWVPLDRQGELRASLSTVRFNQFQITPPPLATAAGTNLLAGQIRRSNDFGGFSPRPIRAHTAVNFAYAEVEAKHVLITHSPTELIFAVPTGATRIAAMYGLADNSYTGGNQTDGIELTVTHQPVSGTAKVLFSRYLNPREKEGDRGPQSLDLALPPGATGELVVRVTAGPNNDASFDWAYFGQCTIR